jgi:hypothetical protein
MSKDKSQCLEAKQNQEAKEEDKRETIDRSNCEKSSQAS